MTKQEEEMGLLSKLSQPVRRLRDYTLLILDLDGTVRECTVEGQPCPNKLGEQRLLPGAGDRIEEAAKAGVIVAFATNQAGPSYGYSTVPMIKMIVEETIILVHQHLRCETEIGVHICFDKNGFRRKPAPGMLLEAMLEAEVEPVRTIFVGDRDSDREAALRAGCAFMTAEDWLAGKLS